MPSLTICPACDSSDVLISHKNSRCYCEDCGHAFEIENEPTTRRIFLSYGRDEYRGLAELVKHDLERRGHEVWYDQDHLHVGSDWEGLIEDGLAWVAEAGVNARILLLMTPHSVRRPDGYCLNEIARALECRVKLVPVMVVWCEPPLSICRIQWLDMRDCVLQLEREAQYRLKFEQLADAIESDREIGDGIQSRLLKWLDPLPFDGEVAAHLRQFTGRKWMIQKIDQWLQDERASRIFWIAGDPGVGKTALAAWLCSHRREIAATHLCRFGHTQKADPRRCVLSLVFQLASQLPDYGTRLTALPLHSIVPGSNARTLFDSLLVQPLSGDFSRPDRPIVILIDALDEASEGGRNELASFLASEFAATPDWLRVIITSRPEPDVLHWLQGITPCRLDPASSGNQQDLRDYIHQCLSPLLQRTNVPVDAVDSIVDRSEGIFLYVKWVCEEIVRGRLRIDAINQFPQGLGGVYAAFFARQFPDIEEFESSIRPGLEVLVAAREPYLQDALAELFNWNEHRRLAFFRSVGSLFPQTNQSISPYHRSITEWLTKPEHAGPYYLSLKEGHGRLFRWSHEQFLRQGRNAPDYVLRHLPAHSIASKNWDTLYELMCNLEFLESRAESGSMFELTNDLTEAIRIWPEQHAGCQTLSLLQEALRRNIHFIARHPETLFQCLWNTVSWGIVASSEEKAVNISHDAAASLKRVLDSWRAEVRQEGRIWVRSLCPPPVPLGSGQQAVLTGHTAAVWSLAFSPDQQRIASASFDKSVRVWSTATGAEICRLDYELDGVLCVTFTPDGQSIVAGMRDGTVRIWNLTNGLVQRELVGHKLGVECVAVSPDGAILASASRDSTVRLWDLSDERELYVFDGHTGATRCVAFSPDGRWLATSSNDQTIRILDVYAHREVMCLTGHTASVKSLAFHDDGTLLVSASYDRTLKVWDLSRPESCVTMEGHTGRVTCGQFLADSSRVFSASDDGTIRLWDSETGSLISTITTKAGAVSDLLVTDDGRDLWAGLWDGTIRRLAADRAAGIEPAYCGHMAPINCLVFSEHGERLITGATDGTVWIWDSATGEPVHSLPGHWASISSVALTVDGRIAATGSQDGTVRVWNAVTGEEISRQVAAWVHRLEFSPDGQRLMYWPMHSRRREWDISSLCPLIPSHLDSPEQLTDRWYAKSNSLETSIRNQRSNQPVAWFPSRVEHATPHPNGRLWAGASGCHLCLITLEGV